jgi:hypothetical protein
MHSYRLAAVLAFGVATGAAQAAPLPAAKSAQPTAQRASGFTADVIPVADRRCWWRNGHRHCRRVAWPAPGYGDTAASNYYEQDARTLPVGSQRWWDIKDREGSTGRP